MSLTLERTFDDIADRKGFELLDGVWVEKPMGNKAATVGSTLHGFLNPFVRANRLGRVLESDAGYRMFADRPNLKRKPDLTFIARGRLKDEIVPNGDFDFAPDLAAEIISPHDLTESIYEKLDEYLRAGVRLVWVVVIPTRSVWAYRSDGTGKLYRDGQLLSGEDVLPGLAVPVAALFDGV